MNRTVKIILYVFVCLLACVSVVSAAPIVDFTGTPVSGYAPLPVDFTTSIAPIITFYHFEWDFGDSTLYYELHAFSPLSRLPYLHRSRYIYRETPLYLV